MHILVSSDFHYFNSVYCSLSQNCLSCLQLVQSAARLQLIQGSIITSPQMLASFHWLPVRFSSAFKVLLLTLEAKIIFLNSSSCTSQITV